MCSQWRTAFPPAESLSEHLCRQESCWSLRYRSSVELEISWQPFHPVSSGAFVRMWADHRSITRNSSPSPAVTADIPVGNKMVCSFLYQPPFFSSIILTLGFWSFWWTFWLFWTFLGTLSWLTDWTLWPWCFCCSSVSTLWNTNVTPCSFDLAQILESAVEFLWWSRLEMVVQLLWLKCASVGFCTVSYQLF